MDSAIDIAVVASDEVVSQMLAGGLGAVLGLVGGPAGAVAGAALGPVMVAALTVQGQARLDVMASFALEEIGRRDAAGEHPRNDLDVEGVTKARELFEGVLVKARDAYESHKCEHLAFFIVTVLYDESQDLGEAFFQLSLAERLTFGQYVLLNVFDRAAHEPDAHPLSTNAFGSNPSPGARSCSCPFSTSSTWACSTRAVRRFLR